MSQVYSTSINKQTIDESPEAYKDKSIVTDNIHDSAEIIAHLKPLYNFKG
jgi:RNA-splicing ligase RtcB